MKLSIVTLTFNNFDELRYTRLSIPENYPEVESVIVNGGRCQKTEKFLHENHQGTFISDPDKGISDGFNKGIALASGKYVMLLNSGDILLEPSYLDYAISYLDQNPEIAFCHADIYFLHPEKGRVYHKPKGRFPGMPYNHQGMVVRKSVYEQVGGFSLEYRFTMDLDWVCRATALGMKGHYYPKAVVEMDGNGVSTTQEGLSMIEAMKVSLKNKSIGGLSGFVELSIVILKIYTKRFLVRLGLYKINKPEINTLE